MLTIPGSMHRMWDVNWAFLRDDVPEIEILQGFLAGRVFAGVIDLHEDWESPGFYLYEMFGDQGALGREMVERVARVCPINENAEIEGEVCGQWGDSSQYGGGKAEVRGGHTYRFVPARTYEASGDVRNPDGAADGCARCGASGSY